MDNVVMKLDKALQNIVKDSERLHWILTGSEGFDECNFDGFSENLLLDFTAWQEIVKEFYHKLHVEKQKVVKPSVLIASALLIDDLIVELEDQLSNLHRIEGSEELVNGKVDVEGVVKVLHVLIHNILDTGELGMFDVNEPSAR